jgi:ribosomal protein S27AE
MGASSSSSKTSKSFTKDSFIEQLRKDYPQFKFKPAAQDYWSSRNDTVYFDAKAPTQKLVYSVLHELSHGLLGHNTYRSDFELLKLESQAWSTATQIGSNYGIVIDDEHIQNCLDTYRDWLHRRSTCPKCGTHVLQKDADNYHCYNCKTDWKVSSDRFVRPYRRKHA